jgi:hypothetical protein
MIGVGSTPRNRQKMACCLKSHYGLSERAFKALTGNSKSLWTKKQLVDRKAAYTNAGVGVHREGLSMLPAAVRISVGCLPAPVPAETQIA